ncbi:MAG: ATP-binding protein, partial [Bacteroidota bacterium]
YWQFSFADQGIGIPLEHQQRIFNLFEKLHNGHEIEGSGIGLALCQRIIDQHEGKIWLESVEGEGTTFHFQLPKKSNSGGSQAPNASFN